MSERTKRWLVLAASFGAIVLIAFGAAFLVTTARAETGEASWYSTESGNTTANGERFDHNALTAAHRSLPFGTRVKVENLRNGRSVIVRINDRGPFVRGRVIDLSKAAARRIGMITSGTAHVSINA